VSSTICPVLGLPWQQAVARRLTCGTHETPARADILYQNIMTVAAAAGEVAAIVLWLDELALVPPGL
jgi:hypothetical protein